MVIFRGLSIVNKIRKADKVVFGLLGSTVVAAAAYEYDKHFQASAAIRTLRTFKDIFIICADYKVNFRVERGVEHLNRVHERSAKRLLRCFQDNGGLFIKFGQSIAIQGPLLPPAYSRELRVLYDNAPFVPVQKIKPVIERNFPGKSLYDIFVEFSEEAVASASVAQVHTARLRSDPTQLVAVKIQKPEIKHQISWDLFAFRTCAQLVEWAFDLPVMWSVNEVEQRLREETDFEREGRNSERANNDLQNLGGQWLRSSVYIPKVHWDATSKEVLTTEWIDGTSLVNPDQLLKEGWVGKDIMRLMVSVFAFQIFVSGNVHGDPHPGNILIRSNPESGHHKAPQLVLLDHGLYINESSKFKRQHSEFWRAAMLNNRTDMNRIARSWGITDTEMFSSMVSLKPPMLSLNTNQTHGKAGRKSNNDEHDIDPKGKYNQQMKFKNYAVKILKESHNLPPELVFVTRNMNIVRANNRSFGAPVSRVQILGQYAAYGLRHVLVNEALSPAWRYDPVRGVMSSRDTLIRRLYGLFVAEWRYITFRIAISISSFGMSLLNTWFTIYSAITGTTHSLEHDSVLDEQALKLIERRFGYSIDASLFEA